MDITSLIVEAVSGAIGGTILQIMMGSAATGGGGMDIQSILANVGGGGVGGAILMIVVAIIKNAMAKK